MSDRSYDRIQVFSEDADYDLSIEFTAGMQTMKLINIPIFRKNAISVQWKDSKQYIKLNMKTGETIPFDKINEIVEFLKKYNVMFHSIILINWYGNLDFTSLKYIPKRLSMRGCIFVNLKCFGFEEINIVEFRSQNKLPPLDISLEQCKNLNKLYISGDYTIGTDTLHKFKHLANLRELVLINSLFGDCNIPLPYFGNCPDLVKLNMSSVNIPEMFEFESNIRHGVYAKKVVKLCRNLKSDPHNRLVDICLALWNLRLSSYVMLWIVNWLPHYDWISTETKTLYKLDKSYSDNANYCKKIPRWTMSNYSKLELIKNINESKRKLINTI